MKKLGMREKFLLKHIREHEQPRGALIRKGMLATARKLYHKGLAEEWNTTTGLRWFLTERGTEITDELKGGEIETT